MEDGVRAEETRIAGAFVVRLDRVEDARGWYARSWCRRDFAALGLGVEIVQSGVSLTRDRGSIRGLHHQVRPARQAKVVGCLAGSLYDVVLDLRPGSPSYGTWMGLELHADDASLLFVPPGCAHGFQALTDDVLVTYLYSGHYSPAHERGVRFDDPSFDFAWPEPVTRISDKDRAWPDCAPLRREMPAR